MPNRMKILLIDDDTFLMDAAAAALRTDGHEVETCGAWVGVSTSVSAVAPDVILLDYNMPFVTGDTVCRILKQSAACRGVRIVLFSSEPEDDLRRIVTECGADGYIRKDVPGPEFVESLRRLSMDWAAA